MRVDWVHPSWRDLVIEHLAGDPDARAEFLSSCSAHGVLLALSISGGERGERELPLLARDADWDALTDRIYQLAPELDVLELQAVLDDIGHEVATLEPPAAQLEAVALARAILERLRTLWDETRAPVPLQALEAWLTLADRLPRTPPRPTPPALGQTWASLLPASAPSLADRESLERFADWLTLADLLREHMPDDLHRFRFRDQGHILNTFIDTLESGHIDVNPAIHDHVQRALNRIETLNPELGNLAFFFHSRLRAARQKLPPEPRRTPPSRPGKGPGWRLFDVARVLDDL